jgi:hypothetical protein
MIIHTCGIPHRVGVRLSSTHRWNREKLWSLSSIGVEKTASRRGNGGGDVTRGTHVCVGSVFYLEIPCDIIDELCLKPLKYLLYLGLCILGAEGRDDEQASETELDRTSDSHGRYAVAVGSRWDLGKCGR